MLFTVGNIEENLLPGQRLGQLKKLELFYLPLLPKKRSAGNKESGSKSAPL